MEITHKRDISFPATDGFPLAGTLFEGDGDGPLVLISSATAVPRGLYAKFAETLVTEHGFRAVLTYDYRGTGGSKKPGVSGRSIKMRDWALYDIPAAFDTLQATAPDHEIIGVGQSFGAQALGLSGRAQHYSRFLMVSPNTGYWRLLNDGWKSWLQIRFFAMPMAALLGHIPKWAGLGDGLPGGVFLEWGRWCLHPDYFFSDKDLQAAERCAEVTTPIFAIGSKDDDWGNPAAQASLLKYYTNAPTEHWWTDPKDVGEPIGHLGFFRSRFKDTLWPRVIDWLKG